MSLLAAAASAAATTTTTTASSIAMDSTSSAVVDFNAATSIVLLYQIPGAVTFREQDDVVHDPTDAAAPYKLYFTAAFSATPDDDSRTYLVTSTNRVTWSAPVACKVGAANLVGQDPSITQTFDQGPPVVYRDGDNKMWMFLERNAPSSYVSLYSSINGVDWTLEQQPAIPRGAAGTWDSDLTGSPVARHDGTQFIVGYEGISGLNEASGLAVGADPKALVKQAGNPILTAPGLGATGTTAFWDAFWVNSAGTRVMVSGHPGYASGLTMFRAYTTNLNPLTWTTSSFVYLGSAGTGREDLTCDLVSQRHITTPSDDLSIVSVPLKAP